MSTGPLLLFTRVCRKYIRWLNPEYLVFAFDSEEEYWRNQLYADYKGGRKTSSGLHQDQFELAMRWCLLVGGMVLSEPGFEADDLIGAVWRALPSVPMAILSGDRDLLQLVSRTVIQIRPEGGTEPESEVWDIDRVKRKFGVDPYHMAIWKALMGDSGDGIPGIPGVGPKRAIKIGDRCGWNWHKILDDQYDHRELIERNLRLIDLREVPIGIIPPIQKFSRTKEGTEMNPDLREFLDDLGLTD